LDQIGNFKMYEPVPLLAALLLMSWNIPRLHEQNEDLAKRGIRDIRQEYDFIVVGGGAGGAVVAARLSENPKNQVLLIEAGGPESIVCQIPALMSRCIGAAGSYTRFYRQIPQESCCQSMNGKSAALPAAHMLGGGTAVNGMMY